MLTPVIRKLIEDKYGEQIRYPVDCDALQHHIFTVCRSRISASTLKRLFGFDKATEPRLQTLDVLASYVGYFSWDKLIDNLCVNACNESETLNELQPSSLKVEDEVELRHKPSSIILIKYTGNDSFIVKMAVNNKLQHGDELTVGRIIQSYPLIIKDVVRNGFSLGHQIVGRCSGITHIKLVNRDI